MAFADGSNWSTMPITYYLFSRSTTGEIGAGTLPQLENLIRESGSPGWLRVPKRHVASLRSTVPADPADYASNIPSYIRELRAKPSFTAFEKATNASLVILPTPSTQDFSRPLRLAVFDMDSTLIQQEVIDELAAMKNLGSLVSSITERAMRGELDFAASLKERCKLLEGIAAPEVWETLKGRIQFAEGARELCGDLKRRGVKMAVLSGGFQQMADWVKAELDLDYAFANHLEVSPATEAYPFTHLTGNLFPLETHPIVTASRKKELLHQIAAENGISLSEVLCVGDGANDLEMLNAVHDAGGMGIAFKAKEKVQKDAGNSISSGSLADLLLLR